jgi:formamidopyrimidine-DNA glycosylase
MPELPEVETIRIQLEKALVGQRIESITSLHAKSLIGHPHLVVGQKVLAVKRFGKMIVIDVEGNCDIGIHLKMTGQLIYRKADGGGHKAEKNELPHKHTRVVIKLKSGDTVYFNDQRIFGWVRIMTQAEMKTLPFIKSLGPEPWDITDADFYKLIHKRQRPIKLVILDQEVISGVGNIYANDALWEAKVKPARRASTLTKADAARLRDAIVKVLREGIKYGGTTAGDDKYVNLEGQPGGYQKHVRVYDRKGETCLRNDGGVIIKVTLGGRGTYYCLVCQK